MYEQLNLLRLQYRADGPFMLEKWGNYKTNPYTRAGVSCHPRIALHILTFPRCQVSSQYCVKDYLQIPGGAGGGGAQGTADRFCGGQVLHCAVSPGGLLCTVLQLAGEHGARAGGTVTTLVTSRLNTLEFHAGTPEGEYKEMATISDWTNTASLSLHTVRV